MTTNKQTKMTETKTTPLVPKEAINLWERIYQDVGKGEPVGSVEDWLTNQLPSIGFPATQADIPSTDFLDGQSRYTRNDDLFVELVKYAIFVKSKQLDIEFRNCNNLHWLLGINSEINELEDALLAEDKTNIIEEIGDILFFLFSYAMEHKVLFTLIGKISNELSNLGKGYSYFDIVSALFRNVAVLSDIEKGTLTSGKGFYKADLLQQIGEISQLLISYVKNETDILYVEKLSGKEKLEGIKKVYHKTFRNLINTNIKKLGGRYEGKFTADEDHNRNSNSERIIMENSIQG